MLALAACAASQPQKTLAFHCAACANMDNSTAHVQADYAACQFAILQTQTAPTNDLVILCMEGKGWQWRWQ